MMQEEQLLQVACRTKTINAGEDEAKYTIIVKQIAKFVVGLGENFLRQTLKKGCASVRIGVLLYGSPGTGKTLSARVVAKRTSACFIRAIRSELVQKYVVERARMVRELFTMARCKKACSF
ncbi:hypothetical protein PsorP6_001083 [Peronosclerospora sorghi]|uniref:Uncharacterized protein n=1 Tax=Peronosclerospora sorghi TaxID=230839 RepID=A0ACC0WSS9_9STRA|nr:hypothetical protein PsorP6_001083 [Peronosclerospora sorghi]